MKQVNLPEDLEGPNDKFFNHALVQTLLNQCGTNETIKWNEVTDLLDLNYTRFYKKLLEITDAIIKKGGKGYFWLVCSPQIGEILGSIKWFVSSFVEQYPLGYPIVMFMGVLDKRWRIYTDLALPNETMLLGAGFSKKHVNYYCNIKIDEFTK